MRTRYPIPALEQPQFPVIILSLLRLFLSVHGQSLLQPRACPLATLPVGTGPPIWDLLAAGSELWACPSGDQPSCLPGTERLLGTEDTVLKAREFPPAMLGLWWTEQIATGVPIYAEGAVRQGHLVQMQDLTCESGESWMTCFPAAPAGLVLLVWRPYSEGQRRAGQDGVGQPFWEPQEKDIA